MCHIAYLIKCITLPSTLVSPKLLHSVTDICFFLLIKVYLPFSSLQAMSILLLPHNIPDSLKHLSTLVDDIWYYAGDRSTDVSRPSQPKYPSPHVFLTPFHQAPHTIRPASAKVTTHHLSSHCTLIVPFTFNSVYPINLHIICPLLSLIVHVGTTDIICQLFINQPNPNVSLD